MSRSAQIQGLRAYAVLLVLIFHAGWNSGGFVGVDVFYVISGYLITGLIIREENFSFANFYARRAKRLLPAAFLVLLVTSILFWIFAPSPGRSQYSKDLLASTWYVSNYLYAHWQNDYQNLGSQPSPLIHYWSLAVEEQFYLIWPLLIVIFRRRLKSAVILLSLSSLLLSIYLVYKAPIFAFYSLPTRAFELGAGALLSIFAIKIKQSFIAWIGIFLIVIAALEFNQNTNFPGLPALLPVIGAALILMASSSNPILSNRIAQKLGDWSYSIYLWHWPLLTIPVLYLQRQLTGIEKLFLIIICIFCAALTYRYLENPLRLSNISNRKVLTSSVVTGLLLSAIAGFIAITPANALNMNEIRKQPVIYKDGCQLDKQATKPNEKCVYGDKQGAKSAVLFGDSHAAQWFPAIDNWAKSKGYKLIVMTKSSCPAFDLPLRDNGAFKANLCNAFRRNALIEIEKLKPVVVIASSFEHYPGITDYESYGPLPIASKQLIIRDTPWPNRDIPTCLTTNRSCVAPKPVTINYKDAQLFDPIPLLCSKNCPAKVDGLVAYRDQTHISVAIAEHFARKLAEKLDSVVAG